MILLLLLTPLNLLCKDVLTELLISHIRLLSLEPLSKNLYVLGCHLQRLHIRNVLHVLHACNA